MLLARISIPIPTHSATPNRTRFKPTAIMMSFTDLNTTTPTGGARYAHSHYILRVVKKACEEGTDPHQTEAILVKKGHVTDIADQIEIHTRDGEIHTSIESYLDGRVNPDAPRFANSWIYVEVLVVTSDYGSGWITGTRFQEESQPCESKEMMVNPPPGALPRGGPAYGVATYRIRHIKNTAPAQPSTKEAATLTIRDTDDHYINNELGQHYSSLAMWHLKNPFATEEDIEKDLATNGSPWSHIDVKVGDDWVTGCTFLAQRRPAQPGDDGPVPRSYGATVYDFDGIGYDVASFMHAYANRASLNLSITEVVEQFGPGIPEGYMFIPEEFDREYEASFMNPQKIWDEMTFAEVMQTFGPRPWPTLPPLPQ